MLDSAAILSGFAQPQDAVANFEAVMRQREAAVLRSAYRMTSNWADAEDIAQEVFTRLHRHGLAHFPNGAALAVWLYRVTVNLSLDRMRAAGPATAELAADASAPGTSVEAQAILDERKDRLMLALEQLAPKERAAVVLREIEGLSTQEVAQVLGSTETTVRSQISKAIARLREILGTMEGKRSS